MHEYENFVYRRDDTVSGLGPWYWIKTDSGAWDGPKQDWETSHSTKWLRSVKTWDVCIQAGSCLGMYPRLLSERFGEVYSFEPDPLNRYVAQLNNQVSNVHLFPAALGCESGRFIGVCRNAMDNVGMHRVGGDGTTPIMTIDSLGLPSCGLIALDLEGFELWALRGAEKTVERCRPVITAEMPSQEVHNLLTGWGYREESQSVSDTVFIPR